MKPISRRITGEQPLDAATTLRIIGRGVHDHALRVDRSITWYAARTPDGPVTCRLEQVDERTVQAEVWGEGAPWQAEFLPDLLGADVELAAVGPLPEVVRTAHRRYPGLRVPRTRRVFDALVPAVLEQRVVGADAVASRRQLMRQLGEPAPGPAPTGMLVPPPARSWELLPSWQWHRAGVDPSRSRAIVRSAQHAARLEEAADMPRDAAYSRLQAVPGIGPWTAAETAKVALGDTDAVSVGDYHLGRFVVWALTGEFNGDDQRMLELLEPFRPLRQLVVRLLELTVPMPRRGPRAPRVDHRRN